MMKPMSSLYFATNNLWKFERAKIYFRERNIQLQQLAIELPESRSEDVKTIAKEKAVYAFKKLKQPVFVMDAGFYITSLNGFPATFVQFCEKYIGSEGIIKLMEGKKIDLGHFRT
jgi:XTP/dITP diphosphohydrolase